MVECSFCCNSKSQRYLYTVCQHFVCLNCAALRGGETLICCSKSTVLGQDIKAELKIKKQSIMNNMEDGYEQERKDVNRFSFDQIENKLSKINHMEDNGKKTRRDTNDSNRVLKMQTDQEMDSTPISQFYSDGKTFEISNFPKSNDKYQSKTQKHQVQVSSPIKLVSGSDEEWENRQRDLVGNVLHSINLSKPSKFKPQVEENQRFLFPKQQFTFLLENKLDFVRKEFSSLHLQLQAMQATMVYEMKVYFEQYLNLVEKDNPFGPIDFSLICREKDRLNSYLSQIQQKWNLKNIAGLIQNQKDFHSQYANFDQKQQKTHNSSLRKQRKQLKGIRPNSEIFNNNLEAKQSYFESLKLNTMRQPQNYQQSDGRCQSATTNRNMDKIYRKLQQSRGKLQERIHLHNQFMNKRCTRLIGV